MRVQYTIPGPAGAPGLGAGAETIEAPSFKKRLRRLSQAIPKSWKQLLRLDRPPASMPIPRPPRPAALESLDAAGERLRWRNTLEKHGGESLLPARRMLALLAEYRRLEEAVIARHLSESNE